MKRLLLSISFICSIALHTAASAAPKAPKGGVKLPSENMFLVNDERGKFLCGLVKKWESGKLVGKAKDYFLPVRVEISQLKKKPKTAAATKKLKKLKNQQKKGKKACAGGPPSTPVAPPNPTPVPTPDHLAEKTTPVTLDDLNHLYRHAGLGVPPQEALSFVGGPVGPLVDYFMTLQSDGAVEDEARTWLDQNTAEPHYPASNPTTTGINMYALRILMKSPNQFHERLALLALHDRLATSSRAVESVTAQRRLMVDHLTLIRQAAWGNLDYAKLVEDIGEDGVMVRWLTLDRNTLTAPNEDYARELMELFSLDTVNNAGEPNYTNEDIINIARAFTGWNLLQVNGQWRVIFTPATFDADPNKTIFAGTAWQGTVQGGRDVVRHIFAHHPNASVSTAKWIAREYLKEDAPEAVIGQLAALVKENNFLLKPVFAKLLKSEEFYKAEYQFSIAKTPVERFVHLTRIMDQVGMPYDFVTVRNSLANMGCVLTQTETVFGCDKLEELPDGQRLLNSANLITSLSNNNNLFNANGFDYSRFFPNPAPSADEMVDHMERVFGLNLPIVRKAAIRDYMNNAMNNNGTLVSEPWNPANTAMVRRKVAGLFRLYAQIPLSHDLR
ncbi:MAG: DUF1800 family protein [Deltaproteobacteria bacterium]|nr:DUF1800 family protein [Deltaproteobacteria bacterium]